MAPATRRLYALMPSDCDEVFGRGVIRSDTTLEEFESLLSFSLKEAGYAMNSVVFIDGDETPLFPSVLYKELKDALVPDQPSSFPIKVIHACMLLCSIIQIHLPAAVIHLCVTLLHRAVCLHEAHCMSAAFGVHHARSRQ